MGYLKLNNLTKKYGDFTAVSNINIDLEKGEMVALLGGSGCGKTTILRMIAGYIGACKACRLRRALSQRAFGRTAAEGCPCESACYGA